MKKYLLPLRQINIIFCLVFILILPDLNGQRQRNDVEDFQEAKFPYPGLVETRNIEIGVGLAGAGVRDFATSPLFYRGGLIGLNLGFSRRNLNREFLCNLHTGVGVLANFYNDTGAASTYVRSGLQIFWLKDINRWSTERFRFLFGPVGQLTNGIRVNPSLGNNGFVMENQANLMLGSKIIADISRSRTIKRPWILGGLKTPKQREISFQFNIGIVNANYRPGYNVSGLPGLRGDDSDARNILFYDYDGKINGLRFTSQLNYTWWIPTGNAYRLSYLWDASTLPGRFESMQVAVHTFQFAFIFKKK